MFITTLARLSSLAVLDLLQVLPGPLQSSEAEILAVGRSLM